MNILITGTSSGLGYELAKQYLENGHTVYGISRSKTDLNIKQVQCDFNHTQNLAIALNELIDKTIKLNAYNKPIPFNSTIAVVGNSGKLLKQNYGELIDSHDIVIRCNLAIVNGFEPYVGS